MPGVHKKGHRYSNKLAAEGMYDIHVSMYDLQLNIYDLNSSMYDFLQRFYFVFYPLTPGVH